MTDLHDSAEQTLKRWTPPSAEQAELRDRYLAHVAEHPDALSRGCHPDHLTASAIVLSHDGSKVLLNLHGRYRRWMQFGGHCEPSDPSLAAAALRETVEECGIAGLRLDPSDPAQLDIHEVRCGPLRPAHHFDVQFVAVAPEGAAARASEESVQVAWFARDELPADLDRSVRTLIDAAGLR
jgi:8-oxo-dGTP pyrophosphatase MutT (NUDIX family)